MSLAPENTAKRIGFATTILVGALLVQSTAAAALDTSFVERVIPSSAASPRSVYVADLDGDADADVLSASFADDKIAWYENDGATPPNFTERVITTDVDGADAVLAVDLDGDGDTDVVAASHRGLNIVAWYENDGAMPPSFIQRVIVAGGDRSSIFAVDIDGDGDTDVLAGTVSGLTFHENDGATPPNFTERLLTSFAATQSVFAADMDGDGDADVLSAVEISDTIAWYENDGASPPNMTVRVITNSADGVFSVFAADVNGDGNTDVLSASVFDDTVAWYESDGAVPPNFSERIIITLAERAISVFAADVDGDGDTDVLSASEDGIAWYENDGTMLPSFTEHLLSASTGDFQRVFADDVNGDGDTDVLSATPASDKISWYENLGSVELVEITASGSCPGVTVIDLETASPEQRVMLFAAPTLGSSLVPGGLCPDTELELDSPRLLNLIRTDVNGHSSLSRTLSQQWCGLNLQMVQVQGCLTSNVEQIP